MEDEDFELRESEVEGGDGWWGAIECYSLMTKGGRGNERVKWVKVGNQELQTERWEPNLAPKKALPGLCLNFLVFR